MGILKNSYLSRMRGGESVSQSPLKDRAFSTFQDQNPPFELRRKMGFRLRQKPVMAVFRDWWRGRLPSEGKGHTFESCRARQCPFVSQDDVPPARLDRSCEILIRAGVIAPEISVLAAQNTRDRRTRACLPSASASASRSPPERASAFGLLTGAGICGYPLEPFR